LSSRSEASDSFSLKWKDIFLYYNTRRVGEKPFPGFTVVKKSALKYTLDILAAAFGQQNMQYKGADK